MLVLSGVHCLCWCFLFGRLVVFDTVWLLFDLPRWCLLFGTASGFVLLIACWLFVSLLKLTGFGFWCFL